MRQILSLAISLAIVLAILFVCAGVSAKLVAAPGEQITSFNADIVVNPDAMLTVTEDFVVHSEGSYLNTALFATCQSTMKLVGTSDTRAHGKRTTGSA